MSSCSMLAPLRRATCIANDCRPADAELQQNLCFLLVGIVYRAQAARRGVLNHHPRACGLRSRPTHIPRHA
jgi:hypothetical protein